MVKVMLAAPKPPVLPPHAPEPCMGDGIPSRSASWAWGGGEGGRDTPMPDCGDGSRLPDLGELRGLIPWEMRGRPAPVRPRDGEDA